MSTPIPYAIVNGVRHDCSSIELKVNGTVYIGFKSIKYSRKRNRTMVRGNHPDPIGKTRGTNDFDATCELYLAEFNALQADLGPGYGDVFFQVLVTYTEAGFDSIQDVLNGCTLDSTEDAGGDGGPDPLTRKFSLSPIKILFNGIDDLATPLVGVPA
jgi:hypothetical protein